MATIRGLSEVRRFLKQLPTDLEGKVLRGAARAAAKVVAEDAKERSISAEVASAVKISVKGEPGRILGKIQVKGPGAYIAPWLEYGTDPHFISIEDSQRDGLSVNRFNKSDKAESLVINGHFVGRTVHHPGARAHPFLRPALDAKEAEAIAAAQAYINSRVSKAGIIGSAEPEE